MILRDATVDDLPAVVALLADDVFGAGRELPGVPIDPRYAAGFAAMAAQGGRVLLVVDGPIVGCLQLNILHGVAQLGQSVAQVESVRVASSCRGQGIGRLLLAHAAAEAQAAGCRTLQLTTRLERDGAQQFYMALGYVRSHAGFKLAL